LYSGPIRQAIHQLKYSRDITLGHILSRPMLGLLGQVGWQVDLIIPIPLSRQRARQRGYNQSTFLAAPLAIATEIPLRPAALSRVRETTAQVGLSGPQRRENVKNAFKAESSLVGGKRILIIDDVTTTGATMEACANALKSAGANTVFGLTLARSNWPDQAG
jgi:ComF family protein